MAIEVVINGQGQTQIPDQTQLRGSLIDSVVVLPPWVASVSAVTGKTNVAILADLQAMTIDLVRASDNVMQNFPLLTLNPYTGSGAIVPSTLLRELFVPQLIDWNQSNIFLGVAPSSASIIVSLGVFYFDPQKPIVTG
jgi:hypothetical protein